MTAETGHGPSEPPRSAAPAAAPGDALVAVWREHERRLRGVAYRMVGSVTEADDLLQEAFVRLQRTGLGDLRDPGAWLTTVVGRLCLNHLDSARVRRERYVGPWLPEPVHVAADQLDEIELAESVAAAFLVVLESLSPSERVAFVLHDVFGHSYADVAAILHRDEVACRQLVSRARRAVEARRPRFTHDATQRRLAAERFLAACDGRDLADLLEVLAPDVALRSDGGGVVGSARRTIVGADRVARFLLGVLGRRAGTEDRLGAVHGAPGMALRRVDGTLSGVISLGVDGDGRVADVSVVVNPDKLRHFDRDGTAGTLA